MPAPWQSWKKLSCKADLDQVREPQPYASPGKGGGKQHAGKAKRKSKGDKKAVAPAPGSGSGSGQGAGGGGGASRSLKDVLHGNSRVMHKHSSSCSPASQDSGSECLNMVADEVIGERGLLGVGGISSYCGTPISSSYVCRGTPLRRFSGCYDCLPPAGYEGLDHRDSPLVCESPKPGCHKCGQYFNKLEALENHQIIRHAVTELNAGDSSRNVVEIIFRTSWLKKEVPCGSIKRILKVHNAQRTINKFEEYRDAVKARASKQPKKHPRCLADGNELLRFHGTTLACTLGFNASSSLCFLANCNVCQIIRAGFPGNRGIHTTSTSGQAHDSVPWPEDDLCKEKRAMVVCRVIAGRVHMDDDRLDATSAPPGFDSLSADAGPHSNMGDLLVFNPRAVLPCFVVVYDVEC